ncbi:hypothetical protein IHE61_30160 [Streptomyces sp. GKU 257-1]|nr:hypothetical protein [Streptomyces sp. GKU 257-1]
MSSTAPAPSAGTKPSPPSPKLRHAPEGARKPLRDSWRYFTGWLVMLTPPAMATSQSPVRMAWQPRWMEASDDEHMVSTAMLGPSSP